MNLKNFGRINRKHVVVVYMAVIGIFVYINWFVGVCSTPRPNPNKTFKSESTTSLSRKILMENVRRTTEVSVCLIQTSVVQNRLINLMVCICVSYYQLEFILIGIFYYLIIKHQQLSFSVILCFITQLKIEICKPSFFSYILKVSVQFCLLKVFLSLK